MGIFRSRKWVTIAVAVVAPFSLNGCLILPGEFTSEMTVLRSGDFSFSYKGQIQLIGLANLLNSGIMDESGKAEFKATCYDDSGGQNIELGEDTDASAADVALMEPQASYAILRGDHRRYAAPLAYQAADDAAKAAEEAANATAEAANAAWQMTERECTPDEVATQKKDWDEQQAASKKRDEEQKKMAQMMLGGIDPKDPKTIARFTKEVERLAAWHKVEHIGNGVFMIDYSTKGRLADDFAFPVIPRYSLGEPMIHVTRWDNRRVRVEAPAFKTDPEMSVMTMLGAGSMMGMTGGASSEKMPEAMAVKGTFTLTTNAPILANNSDEGPEEKGGMAVIRWDVGPATYGAPMALLKLAN